MQPTALIDRKLESTDERHLESVKWVLLRHNFLILRSRISIRSLIIRRSDAKLLHFTDSGSQKMHQKCNDRYGR